MTWTLTDRGFLPNQDPLAGVPDSDFNTVEAFAYELPNLVDSGRFREQFGYTNEAGLYPKGFSWSDFTQAANPRSLEAVFRLYCYLASSWVHARGTKPTPDPKVIPAAISRPLVRLARQLKMPPILAYRSYCLNNWKRIDPTGPIALGNIALIQNFTHEAKKDEDWFILVHVDIEAKANDALHALATLNKVGPFSFGDMSDALDKLHGSLVGMNAAMDRMPEQCSPDVYYDKVRPYIFGFNGVVYDKCYDNEPMTFRGETGAQSTIVPAVIAGLGIRHKDSMLTKHLEEMKDYMPVEHRAFLKECADKGLQTRDWIGQYGRMGHPGKALPEKYNACVEEVIKFRKTHLDYAVQYIHKKVENPNGTGGTPYMKWLAELVEETKTYLFA